MRFPETFLKDPYSKVILFSLFGLITCALVIGPQLELVRAADRYVIATNDVRPQPKQGWKSTPVKPTPKQGWKSTPVKPPPKQGWKSSPSPKTSTTPKTTTAVNTPKRSSGNVQTSIPGVKTSSLPKPSGSTTASKKETTKISPKQGSKSTTQSISRYVNATGEVVELPKGMKPPPKQGWKSSPSPKTSTTPKTTTAVSTSKKPSDNVQASTAGVKTSSHPTSSGSPIASKKETTKATPKQTSKGTPQSVASFEGRDIELKRRDEISKIDGQLQKLDKLKSNYGGRDSAWDQRASDAEDKMKARKEALEKQSDAWSLSHSGRDPKQAAKNNISKSYLERDLKEKTGALERESKRQAELELKQENNVLKPEEMRELRERSKKSYILHKEIEDIKKELNNLPGGEEDARGLYGTLLRGEGYQGEDRRARGR